MSSLQVEKNLLTEEDIAYGEGLLVQQRQGIPFNLSKVRGFYPVNSVEELNALDPVKHPKAVLCESSTAAFYLWDGSQWVLATLASNAVVQLATYDAVRALSAGAVRPQVYVGGRYSYFDGASGHFQYDPTDTTSADNDGTILVDTAGRRWKRQFFGAVDLSWFGLNGTGSIDYALASAVAVCTALGVTKITVPDGAYTTSGGLVFDTPPKGIEIRGSKSWFGAQITHPTNNVAIKFKGASGGLFANVKISGLRFIGNSGAAAAAFEFADSWGNSVEDFYVTGYSAYAAIVLHNETSWTENFKTRNLMSRGNKALFKFKRTPGTGGTDSFFGMQCIDTWHQFGVAGSYMFDLMQASTGEADRLRLYGADLDIGGWFEGGGGHRVFRVSGHNQVIESRVKTRFDGYGGISDGSDIWVFRTDASTALIDVDCETANQQGGSINLTALATGSTTFAIQHLVCQNNQFEFSSDLRPCARARGAKIRFIQNSVATDKTLYISRLPAYSTWRATVRVNGANYEYGEQFMITVGRQNWLPRVISQTVPPTSANNAVNGNFALSAVGGGTGGGFSASGGSVIEWRILAATQGGTYTVSLEMEML